ncbi:SMI1/KNR4 family protein [Streptomyces sp. NPDC017413]|uniref:SMI1/KNR4 family protein n=1 Tax=Streptomyces sp. NPDC017413 TaxID=3364994 RepID=UPI00379739A1
MTAPISESWTRIENWLAEHAPTTYGALAPPADPADIAATERDIGHPLPRPLVTSLLRHDGLRDQGGELLPGFYRPIGARRIADEWRRLTVYYDRRTAEEIGADEGDFDFMGRGFSSVLYGHPRLIPIARDVGGGYLVLDQRPETDRGRVHQAEAVEGVTRGSHEVWASLPVLMETVAASLETGRPVEHFRPEVDEQQRLRWNVILLPDDRAVGDRAVRQP